MSELLISDWVVELLEDWDAELPFGLDLGVADSIVESVTVMFMVGGSAAGSPTVGDGVGGSLSSGGRVTQKHTRLVSLLVGGGVVS